MTRIACLGVLVASLCGCGGGESARTLPTVPVGGTVTYMGQPVADATVIFAPIQSGEDSFAATARTDANGKYELSTGFGPSTEVEGAVAGDYTVTIIKVKQAAPVATGGGSPNPADIAQQMGAANRDRTAPSSAPRMGSMGRPSSSAATPELTQEDSEIPVAYSSAKTTPLTKVTVPDGTYDFNLDGASK